MYKFDSSNCKCCFQNEQLHYEKKQRSRLASKRYYLRNREEIILRVLKNYKYKT
jgi:hypothetical protein